MFPLSLYLLHQLYLYSHLLSPSTALFIPLLCGRIYPGLWSPIFCRDWEPCHLIPLQSFSFFSRLVGSFLPFSLCFHIQPMYFSPSSHSFPLMKATAPFLTSVSPFLSTEVDFCHLQPSTSVQGRLWNMWLFFWWLHTIPQCFGISSPAAFWECDSRMATLFFPALPLWVPYRIPTPLSPPTPVGLNSSKMV